MLICWNCHQRFAKKIVLRDGIIRGREEAAGGPFRVYRCPRCGKDSRIESTPKGRMFASPARDFSPVEYLFGIVEPLGPADFLKIARWNRDHGAMRRRFFEVDGDRRYSGFSLRDLLARLLLRKTPAAATPPERRTPESVRRTQAQSRTKKTPLPSTPRTEIPHPYLILGVPPGASDAQIRRAFLRLARRWHPDKQPQQDPRLLKEANRRLAELVRAYEELRHHES